MKMLEQRFRWVSEAAIYCVRRHHNTDGADYKHYEDDKCRTIDE